VVDQNVEASLVEEQKVFGEIVDFEEQEKVFEQTDES
jgi:hypothetical protein